MTEVILLGTGTSHGVPMIGCTCPVCTSTDPRDKRTRPSAFVRYGDVRILIDTAPELRLQCIQNGIDAVDAVLFTHHHADHVFGIDDLRRFNWLMRRSVPCYGTEKTMDALSRMFGYAFQPPAGPTLHSRPKLEPRRIDDRPFDLNGRTVIPIPVWHGPMPVTGFRFGRFAYLTDCNAIPDDSLDRLRGLDVLVLDALRRTPHSTHFNLEQAVAMAKQIGADRTLFTHIAHELRHEETNAELPDGMALAYDGQRVFLDD